MKYIIYKREKKDELRRAEDDRSLIFRNNMTPFHVNGFTYDECAKLNEHYQTIKRENPEIFLLAKETVSIYRSMSWG